MCGLAGIMMADGSSADPAILERMNFALAHRGPDGAHIHINGSVGLAHTRLAIIDLTTGDQPLVGPRGCTLVANGEIYNNVELREGPLKDAPFKTRSDCEPILYLYEKYGIDCARHLRGMYGFALHDPSRNQLLLSRDPFGIKPLYYVETSEFFAFASEPQALIAAGLIRPEMNEDVAVELLQLQFTTGARTIFDGIYRLLPGESLMIENGRVVSRQHVAALPSGGPVEVAERPALAQLDAVLSNSVLVHQRSDVPYGLFLSSGVDSASILSCMARLNSEPVIAYTASFPGTDVANEFPQAQIAAKAVGARHVKVEVTPADFWADLPKIAACVDDPTADYAIVPTYLLAREAAKDLKVILCGEGGDEIFAGYGRYRRQIRPWWLGGKQRRRKGPFSQSKILLSEPTGWRDGIINAEREAATPGRSKLQQAQAADCVDWLPHGLLIKLDRCLMAHGLEGRTPFLDPKIAEFGFVLPQSLQLRDRRGKYLLRRWLQDHLPEAAPFAKKKGFTVPVGQWIASEGAKLGKLVAADPGVAELCHPDRVRAVFESHAKHDLEAAWRLLFFALWHRRHIRGHAPDGDVFSCLAER